MPDHALSSPYADTLRACASEPPDLGVQEFKQVADWDYLPEIVPGSDHVGSVMTEGQLLLGGSEDLIVLAHLVLPVCDARP
jgi:hypothetical protein